MERNVLKVDESIPVPGATGRTVLDRLRATLESEMAWTVTAPADGVLQIASSKRRLGGRRNLVCTVRAVNDPKGLTVTLNGELDPAHRQTVRDAILGRSVDPRPTTVPTFTPPTVDRGAAPFVPPSDWFVAPDSVGSPPPASVPPSVPAEAEAEVTMLRSSVNRREPATEPGIRLVLDDGRTFEVGDLTLLGRAPALRPTDGTKAVFVRVDDPALSKTHLALGLDHGFLWIEDRNSRNGVHILAGDRVVALPSGERVTRSVPIEMMAGDTRIVIDRQPGGGGA